ncbi:hypothetical protein HNR46_002476 [Haloferula luteola]|uniref:DUF2269 family protein n=1 Tax=Haloferula luteola TaxID=595692 RepID=A0A840V3X8_9BACT|nr:hypothetical protein [Haloferula luteola]MBB5352233.1 hypothetical protein [Haloferula luteola]
MDYNLLKALHILAAFGVFSAVGAACLGGSRKAAGILHGISLILLILVGFALLQKPPAGQYWWMAKMGLWLILGAAPALTKRLPKAAVLGIMLACGLAAAYLGLQKPF